MQKQFDYFKDELEKLDNDDFDYFGDRLKAVRHELRDSHGELFSLDNVSHITKIHKSIIFRIENNQLKKGSSHKHILKLLNLYKLNDYNPLWLITKDNLFINKKIVDSDILLNKSNISSSSSEFIETIEKTIETIEKTIENLHKSIKEFKDNMKG